MRKVSKNLSVIFVSICLTMIAAYLIYLSQSIVRIVNLAPDSNFALLINVLNKFWAEAIFFSIMVAFVVQVIVLIVLFFNANVNIFNEEYFLKTYGVKLLTLFILIVFTTFSFVILMAATTPENSSFTLNFLPYIGSIFIFGYTIFFKDKK